ncbi:MAG: hypothetical protein M1386_04050 [Candidatus Thermoplasmatota archaeon]|nr:hypothetical protein [Candidatus Thermoplasmatota archaeon]
MTKVSKNWNALEGKSVKLLNDKLFVRPPFPLGSFFTMTILDYDFFSRF